MNRSNLLLPVLVSALLSTGDGGQEQAGDAALATPEVLWSFQTGGEIWSSAVQDQGVLYFGSDDNCLYALSLEGGELRWKSATGGRVRSAPALGEGLVFFASDDGYLRAVKRGDGSEHWRFDLECQGLARVLPSIHPPFAYDYLQSAPLLVDGVVHVGSANGVLYAIDAGSGEERWRFETKGRLRSSPRAAEDALFVGSWDGKLYCLDRGSGEERWSFDTGGILQASPALGEGRVYIGSRNPKVFALDAQTGEVAWEFAHGDGSWVESTGVVHDGILYLGSSDALALFAFDAASGELLSKFRTGAWSWCTPVVDEQALLIGGISAEPYYFPGVTLERGLWAIDPVSLEPLWHFPTEKLPGFLTGGVFAAPRIVGGVAYFGALDGRMYAVSL